MAWLRFYPRSRQISAIGKRNPGNLPIQSAHLLHLPNFQSPQQRESPPLPRCLAIHLLILRHSLPYLAQEGAASCDDAILQNCVTSQNLLHRHDPARSHSRRDLLLSWSARLKSYRFIATAGSTTATIAPEEHPDGSSPSARYATDCYHQ